MSSRDSLLAEIRQGDKAKSAYDIYLKEHIKKVNAQLFEEFCNTPSSQEQRVLEIKRLQSANQGLYISIMQDIETGKMASKQLELLDKGVTNE